MHLERFKRSTNVAYDFFDESSTKGIILTNPILSLINNLYHASTVENASKAISIIGPYGTGKSTGLLFVLKYFSNSLPLYQQEELIKHHTSKSPLGVISNHKILLEKYYQPCIVVGKRETLNDVLFKELKSIGNKFGIKGRIKSTIEIIKKLLIVLKAENCGLLIVVDELGKFLENAVDNPSEGDVFVLQDIAEMAARYNGELIIVTSRHQSFESYASSLSNAEINEWKKIQGRYHDIVFQSTTKESLIFISQAIKPLFENNFISKNSKEIDFNKKFINSIPSPIFKDLNGIETIIHCIHPLVAVLITPLFKKLAQNERSVFSFLYSPEQFSLSSYLQENKKSIYKLHDFFDYIFANLSYAINNTSLANIWSQIESTLLKLHEITEFELKVFKTISILDMFKDVYHLDSNESIISFSIHNAKENNKSVLKAIKTIEKLDAISYNETWKTYHVKYSGNVDVDALINKRIRSDFDHSEFIKDINDNVPLPPILAKEHYGKTGTIRYFQQKYCDENFHLGEEYKASEKPTPTIYHILYSSEKAKEFIIQSLTDNLAENIVPTGSVIFFIKLSKRLEKIYSYYQAVLGVKIHEHSIINDEVAFKRINKELLKAENDLENEIRKIYHSENEILLWSEINGIEAIHSIHSINRLLSEIFDRKFPYTPWIFNELTNKTKPSPSATIGIKSLLRNMLNAGDEDLGIKSGSQLGMYYSILKKTGLYRIEKGVYNFYKPSDPNLKKLWNSLESLMTKPDNEKFSLLEIYRVMESEPFGIKKGLHLILALAFFQCHTGEISWYEDGKFIIDLNGSVLDLMRKRPQDFSFRYVKTSSLNTQFLQNLIKEFKISKVNESTITPLDILAPILSEISSLPEYSKNTEQSLEQSVIKMRKAVFNAKEPETLLYYELPAAFGLPNYFKMSDDEKKTFIKFFSSAYLNLKTVYPRLLENIKEIILSIFKVSNRQELVARISFQKKLNDKKLNPFIKRILDSNQSDDSWIESVASAVIPNPPRFWKDQDLDQFEIELGLFVYRYELLEKLNQSKIIDESSHQRIENAKKSILDNPNFLQLSFEEKDYLITQLIDELIFRENA